MGTKPFSNVILLCEDTQQEVFASAFLQAYYGIHRHRIRTNKSLSGEGSGKQFVQKNYPIQVQAYRSAKNHQKIALVVVMDVDTNTREAEQAYLDKMLKAAEIAERTQDEAIAIFLPKRNIETWIQFLQGQAVDESRDYPHLKSESDCIPFVRQLAEDCKQGKPLAETAPESLKVACEELQRLPKF